MQRKFRTCAKHIAFALGFSAFLPGAAFAAPPAPTDQARVITYVPGRVLVQPRAGLDEQELDKALKVHGGRRAKHLKGVNVHVIELPPKANEMAVVKALQNNPHIKFAELDEVVTPDMLLNDPYLSQYWQLPKINATAAWDVSTGTNVIVAVLDTGIDSSHPDLTARLVPGWNIFENNSNTADVHGHGTATAGTIGEAGNNAIGGAGVAWNAKIMPIRIADSTGYSTFSLIAAGINWAADHGAKVASISFKNLGNSSSVISAAQYMRSKGGVVVVAAGNDGTLQGTTPNSNLTTVGATDSNDARASFSNYGNFVDVVAPGVSVRTTLRGGGYGYGTGTSFATPLTAGVYALMLSANPSLAPASLDSILFSSTDDIGSTGYDIYFGYGRINAAKAVSAAKGTNTADTTSPTSSIASPYSGSKVTGTVAVNVNASDNIGVTKVELYANGSLVAVDTTTPFAFSWNTNALSDGDVNLYSRAYDAAGNAGASVPVKVTVTNDTTAPTTVISSPSNGAKVSGTVMISVNATDNKKVSKISLLIDGAEVAVSYGSSLSYSWLTRPTGTPATITARAYDPSNNVGIATVTVYR